MRDSQRFSILEWGLNGEDRGESRFLQNSENQPIMRSHNTIGNYRFEKDEVYLFHACDPDCPSDSSLWALINDFDGNSLRIESSTTDLQTFVRWKPLPAKYRYCRPATRDELREFATAYAYSEALQSCR